MTHRVLVAAGAVFLAALAGCGGGGTTGKPSQDTFELFIPQD
jgi:hypothetical protein